MEIINVIFSLAIIIGIIKIIYSIVRSVAINVDDIFIRPKKQKDLGALIANEILSKIDISEIKKIECHIEDDRDDPRYYTRKTPGVKIIRGYNILLKNGNTFSWDASSHNYKIYGIDSIKRVTHSLSRALGMPCYPKYESPYKCFVGYEILCKEEAQLKDEKIRRELQQPTII